MGRASTGRLLLSCAALLLVTVGIGGPRRAMAAEPQAAAAPTTAPAVPVLCLKAHDPSGADESKVGSLLTRELVRQALLVAAREELGLSTRDQTLREPFPAADGGGAGVRRIDITTSASNAQRQVHYAIGDEKGSDLLTGVITTANNVGRYPHPTQLLERVEAMSRGEFVQALRKGGFDGRPVGRGDGDVAEDVAQALEDLEILSQFGAMRSLHAMMREKGQSPQLLGALARGYANLAQLTQFHWSSNHRALTARSLLYAQRLVVAYPDAAMSYWHRAYAFTLAGLHEWAIQDIEHAEQLEDWEAPPAWGKLLRPACTYDTNLLTALAEEEESVAPLAMFLAFLTVENSGIQGATMGVASAAAEVNPQCLRLIDAMCDQTGPGMLNELTPRGARVFSQTLGQRLASLPGFPESVVQVIRENRRPGGNPEGRKLVAQALLAEGAAGRDGGEPSWGVLARLIEETTFAHVRRQAHLIAAEWGVDASDYLEESLPLIEDHPFRAVVEVYGPYGRDDLKGILESMSKVCLDDATFTMHPFATKMYRTGVPRDTRERPVYGVAFYHADPVAWDMERIINMGLDSDDSAYVIEYLNDIRWVSPHSPVGIAGRILRQWDGVQEQAAQIEADHGSHPAIAKALGLQYQEAKRWADAERCFRKYMDATEDRLAYELLAGVYWAQGQPDKWRATLEEFLKQEDYGLQHARVRVRIADYLMEQGDFQGALPYAETAAQTAASWAMQCAARAHEGLGNWRQAEAWIREDAEHYEHPEQWFIWCLRTGHGNVRQAKAAAARHVARVLRHRTDEPTLMEVAAFHLFAGETDQAFPAMERAWQAGDNPWVALHLALTAEQRQDAAKRDQVMAELATRGDKDRPQLLRLGALFQQAWKEGTTPDLSPEAIARLTADATPNDSANVRYFAARFLELRGQRDAALGLYREAAMSPAFGAYSVTLARMVMRANGIEVATTRPTNVPAKAPATAPERDDR